MQSENEYIGDDNFKKFLIHYNCPTPLHVVKMKFAGAICSPNPNLRPTDVISSFWEEGLEPRLETKNEAELFFKFFMGLWDEMFAQIGFNKLKLSECHNQDVAQEALKHYEEVELGFLEGFWGGQSDLKIPVYLSEVIDSLTDLASVYQVLIERAHKGEGTELLLKTLKDTNKMVNKAFSFVIENYVLPKIRNIH